MTDDLLVATQGGDQCDVRPSSGPPEQPRVGTDALSQHVSGAAAVPLLLAAWRSGKPRSLGTPGHLGARGGGSRSWPPQSHDKARGPMSGELPAKQGDGIDNSPLRPTLPDGSEAGPRWPIPRRSSTSGASEIATAARRHENSKASAAQGEPQAPDRRASADQERPLASLADRAHRCLPRCAHFQEGSDRAGAMPTTLFSSESSYRPTTCPQFTATM